MTKLQQCGNDQHLKFEMKRSVNPLQLFSRISWIINSSSELSSFLKYELAPRAPSLFDDVSMRKSTKAVLATLLDSMVPMRVTYQIGTLFVVHTVYGGHRGWTSSSCCNLATPSNIRWQPNPWSKIAGHPEHQPLMLCSLAVCILRPLWQSFLEVEPTNLVVLLRYHPLSSKQV